MLISVKNLSKTNGIKKIVDEVSVHRTAVMDEIAHLHVE